MEKGAEKRGLEDGVNGRREKSSGNPAGFLGKSAEKVKSGKRTHKKKGKGKKHKKEKHSGKGKSHKAKKKPKRRKHVKASSESSSQSSSSSLVLVCPEQKLRGALEQGDVLLAQRIIEKLGMKWHNAAGDGVLHIVAKANSPDIVSWMLAQHGADLDLNMRNGRGETPLLVAARLFRGTIALRLVEAMADPGATDEAGESPESFDLDGLLDEAEKQAASAERTEREHIMRAVAASRRRREDAEWRERLLYEAGVDEHEPFGGYEDLERRDSGGRDWADDVALEARERARAEARARTRERLRAALEAGVRARLRAEAQEAAARAAAEREAEQRRRAAEDHGGGARAAGPEPRARAEAPPEEREEQREEARIAARARDEARWRAFEARLASMSASTSQRAAAPGRWLQATEIPWPSGPRENPLNINPAGHPSVIRSQIRSGLLRWHPDKFMQRTDHLLEPGETKDVILQRVKDTAQQLNRLMAELLRGVDTPPPSEGS